jgi:hypothetical protein
VDNLGGSQNDKVATTPLLSDALGFAIVRCDRKLPMMRDRKRHGLAIIEFDRKIDLCGHLVGIAKFVSRHGCQWR